jgi:hypothetical protein
VHAEVIHVIVTGQLVLLGGKPHQSLVVDVEAKWLAPSYQHVDPEVELETLVEEGIGDVDLDDAVVVLLDFCLLYYSQYQRCLG